MSINETERKLWDFANDLMANSRLTSMQYSSPVLGLIFLSYADHKFTKKQSEMINRMNQSRTKISKIDYQAAGILYLPDASKYGVEQSPISN